MVSDWREQRELFRSRRPEVERLTKGPVAEVRMVELEAALIDRRWLTPPPAVQVYR